MTVGQHAVNVCRRVIDRTIVKREECVFVMMTYVKGQEPSPSWRGCPLPEGEGGRLLHVTVIANHNSLSTFFQFTHRLYGRARQGRTRPRAFRTAKTGSLAYCSGPAPQELHDDS